MNHRSPFRSEIGSRFSGGLLAILALISWTGCLSRPALVRETHLFQLPSTGTETASVATQEQAPPPTNPSAEKRTVELRTLTVAPPFESQSFVYRISDTAYELDPYAGFLVPPARSLAHTLRSAWQQHPQIADLVDPRSRQSPDRRLEIHITELYGDFRDRNHPAAVLGLQQVVLNAGFQVVDRLEIQERVVLQERSAQAVISGWNEALARMLPTLTARLLSEN